MERWELEEITLLVEIMEDAGTRLEQEFDEKLAREFNPSPEEKNMATTAYRRQLVAWRVLRKVKRIQAGIARRSEYNK